MATSMSMNQVFLFSLIHYFGVSYSLSFYGLISLYVLYSKRNIEPFCSEAKFSDKKVLAQQSRLHGKFSSRLAGIPANRAEIFPCNREVDF